jgi:hypothetical protein
VAWQALSALGRTVSGGIIAIDLKPDLRVFSYVLAISVLAGLSFTLAPADPFRPAAVMLVAAAHAAHPALPKSPDSSPLP